MRAGFEIPCAVGLVGVMLLLGCSGGVTPDVGGTAEGVVGLTAPGGEDLCELCLKPIVEATVVVLETASDGAVHRYRCVLCALAAARDWSTGDVQLRATSALEGAPVELNRREGQWEARPVSALVLALPETGDECLDKHVVLADQSEFEAYAGEHKEVGAVRPFAATDTERILDAGKPPAPKEAKCPVSGQTVQVNDKTPWTMYAGETFYFCCAGCKPRFTKDPEGYLSGTALRPDTGGEGRGCGGGCGSHGPESDGGCGGAGVESTPGEGEAQQLGIDEPRAGAD
jgi:YHS domain-containing protein